MEYTMSRMTAALALLALIASVTIVHARGGRTTPADCDAGSADPDCPDSSDSSGKPPSSSSAKKQSLNDTGTNIGRPFSTG